MSKRWAMLVLPLAAIAAVVWMLPLAQAGTPNRNHPVNATLKCRQVEANGPVTIDACLLRDRRLGEGAAIIRTRSAGGTELTINFKVWYGAGLQRGTGTLNFTPNPDGSATFTGTARFTGGTGKFKGITGQLRARDGTVAVDGLVTVTVVGNARY